MSPTVTQLDGLFRTLEIARGRQRLVAFQEFCQAVIAAQQRGEADIHRATSFIERAVAYPELQEYKPTARILEQASNLQSSLGEYARDAAADWRQDRDLSSGRHR